jgi:outer membrane protein OmpA-like peptidoglycan-associated protein/tetratricopeptide (TPR) repeat protein
MRITITVLLFAFVVTLCTAQTNYVPPKVSEKYKKALDQAVLQAKGGQADQAIAEIKDIIVKYPSWIAPRQALSKIYYETGNKELSIEQLELSLAIDTFSQLQELFTLGRLYEGANEPEKAIHCYEAVIQMGANDQELIERATKNKEALTNKSELWTNAEPITFRSFDADINTPNHESLGRWTLDGQQMVFTRLLNGQEDIFFASFDTLAGLWQIAEFAYNSPQNEGAHALSPDGNYLIFTSCNKYDSQGGCDLYLSFKQGGVWTKPTNMGPAFNNAAWDGQPCFGLDGLSLFFSSSRPGGFGGRDIWYVYQLSAGRWSRPVNAGPAINTADNEESPFVHFDGQSIYFMRDGKEGLGGYDLYMARKDINGIWKPAFNLGAPINSGADEGALTLHPDGRRAIITRMTAENKNDLFEFELPKKYRSTPLQALRASITDQVTGSPVYARLELFEISQQDTIRMSQWADQAGGISVATQRNTQYGLLVEAEGYLLYSASLAPDSSELREIEIVLTPLTGSENKEIVLQNIFFESGSAKLLSTSDAELNKLLWSLRKNTSLRIEISGHTDNVGNVEANQKLSEERAKAVYDYLISRGIDAERLAYAGYGESQPIADNTTASGRQSNRRTAFKVIAN